MANSRQGIVFILCGVVLLVCVYSISHRTTEKQETRRQYTEENDNPGITNIFIPKGQRYKQNEGIIYDCFSNKPRRTVEHSRGIRSFSTAATSEMHQENDKHRQKNFEAIFENQAWEDIYDGPIDKMSADFRASGPGSTLQAAQAPLALLNVLVERLKVSLNTQIITIVDIPCGDFYWMREFVGRRQDVSYTGIDIVPTLIERHNTEFKDMSNAHFVHRDIVKDGLNRPYDIILCRDLFQHLALRDIMTVLDHFSKSGSELLVMVTHQPEENIEVPFKNRGRARIFNLLKPPFSLVAPVCSITDNVNSHHTKELGVWTLPLRQQN